MAIPSFLANHFFIFINPTNEIGSFFLAGNLQALTVFGGLYNVAGFEHRT